MQRQENVHVVTADWVSGQDGKRYRLRLTAAVLVNEGPAHYRYCLGKQIETSSQ